jgi:DNA-binding NtrC family response regulator
VAELEPPPSAPAPADGVARPGGLTLDEVERHLHRRHAAAPGRQRQRQAAEVLGVSRKVLWQRRKRHGMLAGRE